MYIYYDSLSVVGEVYAVYKKGLRDKSFIFS